MSKEEREERVISLLRSLWITLRLEGNTDKEATLASFLFALHPFSVDAIKNTIAKLCLGQIDEAHKRFSPSAPELATYVREEQTRLNRLNQPTPAKRLPKSGGWIDPRIAKREQLEDEGWNMIEQDISPIEFQKRQRAQAYRDKRVRYVGLLGEVWITNKRDQPHELEGANA
jgi:hypothetical protein